MKRIFFFNRILPLSFLVLFIQVLGCTSVRSVAVGDTYIGTASYYGEGYEGRQTASGETFDKNELTAAHRFLPFGTLVNVTNLENERNVELRINDRGPFVRGRIIDVSERAAKLLGFINQGTVKVHIMVIQFSEAGSVSQAPSLPRTW